MPWGPPGRLTVEGADHYENEKYNNHIRNKERLIVYT